MQTHAHIYASNERANRRAVFVHVVVTNTNTTQFFLINQIASAFERIMNDPTTYAKAHEHTDRIRPHFYLA